MPPSKPLRQWFGSIDALHEVVVDPLYGWNDPNRRAATMVRGAPTEAADALSRRLGRRENAVWSEAASAAAEAIESSLAEFPLPTEPGAHAALGGLYADGELVYTASSMPI